jgi:hypothetical protein
MNCSLCGSGSGLLSRYLLSVRLGGLLAEIRTRDCTNTKPDQGLPFHARYVDTLKRHYRPLTPLPAHQDTLDAIKSCSPHAILYPSPSKH